VNKIILEFGKYYDPPQDPPWPHRLGMHNVTHTSIATGSRALLTCSNHGRGQPSTFEHYFASCLPVEGEITALEVRNVRFNCVK
jgi:hypothetical protein